MDKKLNIDINNINIHELDDVISIDRDVDVGLHLPQEVIGKGLEFTNIRNCENLELSNLWKNLNNLMRNLYIQSADKKGLNAYRRLIDDVKIKGDLENQRKIIYALWNLVTEWTHRTLLKWLDAAVGKDNYEVELLYNDYEIIFELKIQKTIFDMPWLEKELRKIIPANLLMSFRLYILDELVIKDKTNTYKTKYWIVNEVPCGRVPQEAYRGKKFSDVVKVPNKSSVRNNRRVRVNEVKSGGVVNK